MKTERKVAFAEQQRLHERATMWRSKYTNLLNLKPGDAESNH